MDVPRVEVYERKDGGFDWRLIGRNGEQMGESSQGFTERNDAHEGFADVVFWLVGGTLTKTLSETTIVDVDRNGQPIS